MRVTRSGHPRRVAALAAVAACATAGTLLVAPGSPARAGDPPPNPSNGQINSAQRRKATLADQVGRLNAKVASMQNELQQLQAAQELAEQKVAYALSRLRDARTAARTAQNAVGSAQAKLAAARQQFRAYAQAAYMSGSVDGTTGSLLTASDPSALLQQSALQGYESSHQLDAVDRLQGATVAKSNADAVARRAVQRRSQAAADAAAAQRAASNAVLSAQEQAQQLRSTLASSQGQLRAAQERLATLNHQRAAYIAYQKRQAAIRRARRLARERALARARRLAAERAREQAQNTGGSSGAPGSGSGSSPAPQPSGGGWSPARGLAAVHRAERYLGWPYAWAGGNASGPTYGICAGNGAWNDCHVLGFDCSGLSLYAWAPYQTLPHFAQAQYYTAGSYHPSTSQLRPGDLTFWSSNGSVSGIHHVAIYIGNGNVIQAPQSGDVIKITPLGDVDWGYYGATRPLT